MSEERNEELNQQTNNQPVNPAKPTDELSEDELDKVAGGRKAGGEQQEYFVIKMNDVIITSVSSDGK